MTLKLKIYSLYLVQVVRTRVGVMSFFFCMRSMQNTGCPLLTCQSRTSLKTQSSSRTKPPQWHFKFRKSICFVTGKKESMELCEQGDSLTMYRPGRWQPYCSCWVTSFPTTLHSAAPASRPSSHTQPALVSGDHHIPNKDKTLRLLPKSLNGNALIPRQASLPVSFLLAALPGELGIHSAVSFIFCPESY